MKTFVEYEDPYADLSEIGQVGTLRFCFATFTDDNTVRGQHLFVKCRDFLNDVVIGSHGGYETPEIYGFTYDGKANPIDTDKTRMVMMMRTEREANNFKLNLKKLNNMLTSSGLEKTTIEEINVPSSENELATEKRYFLVEGDAQFTKHVTSMSFYSLMLRVSTTYEIPQDMSFARYLHEEGLHSINDLEYLQEFNSAFNHPKDFIRNMELLDMEDVHSSVRNLEEMEPAHERGGIKIFSELVKALRIGTLQITLQNNCCLDGDEDEEELDHQFPTLNSARAFA